MPKMRYEYDRSKGHRARARVEKELKKCGMVCNNCHAEIHAGVTEL